MATSKKSGKTSQKGQTKSTHVDTSDPSQRDPPAVLPAVTRALRQLQTIKDAIAPLEQALREIAKKQKPV
jgi:hypothetical protein